MYIIFIINFCIVYLIVCFVIFFGMYSLIKINSVKEIVYIYFRIFSKIIYFRFLCNICKSINFVIVI